VTGRPPRPPGAARWTWIDLRLVPAAAAVWLAALVAPRLSPLSLFAAAAGATALAVVLLRHRDRAAVLVLLGLLAGLAVATSAAAVRDLAREASPLWAAGPGRSVEVDLRLDGVPRPLTGAGPRRVVADATVVRVATGASATRTDDTVLLFAPAEGWADLPPGQPVRARAVVSKSIGSAEVAVLSARGPPAPLGDPSRLHRAASALRDGLARASARVLGSGPGGLLPGIVVGDTRAMDPLLTADFRRAGLAHLTAVSGTNVG